MATEQESTAFFHVRFPDKGAGATRYQGYVEGTDEADVRERAAEHPRLNMYDATKGDVTKTAVYGYMLDDLADLLSKPANPNEAIRTDGTVLLRDRENGGLREADTTHD